MARKRKKQRINKLPSQKHFQNANDRPTVAPKKNKFNFWIVVGGIASIITILIAGPQIIHFFSTPHQKYENESFVKGELKPSKISEEADLSEPATDNNAYYINTIDTSFSDDGHRGDGSLTLFDIKSKKKYKINIISTVGTQAVNGSLPFHKIDTGNHLYPNIRGILIPNVERLPEIEIRMGAMIIQLPVNFFRVGVNILGLSPYTICADRELVLGVKDNRLYVSTEFKDLQKEEVIGNIEFNHWKLYKPNFLDFRNDDHKLEVRDKQGYIVFSIHFAAPNKLIVQGYFIGANAIATVNNITDAFCYDKSNPHWRDSAINRISKMKSIFNDHPF